MAATKQCESLSGKQFEQFTLVFLFQFYCWKFKMKDTFSHLVWMILLLYMLMLDTAVHSVCLDRLNLFRDLLHTNHITQIINVIRWMGNEFQDIPSRTFWFGEFDSYSISCWEELPIK